MSSFTTVAMAFIISGLIAIIDVSDNDDFLMFDYIRIWIFNFSQDKNLELSSPIILCVTMIIYFFILYFCLLGLRFLLGIFLKGNIGVNLQFNILNTRLGSYLHKHRLGYIINLAFLGDLFQLSILVAIYIKCLCISMVMGYYDSELYIMIFLKISLCYFPIIIVVLNFFSIINPIKTHSVKYLKSNKMALILCESKVPRSSSSMPPNKKIYTEWFILDEFEFKYLIELKFCVNILIAVVYIEKDCNLFRLNQVLDKYRAYYIIPHITGVLYLNSYNKLDWDRININKNCFDYYYKYSYLDDFNPSMNIMEKIEGILLSSKDIDKLLNILPLELINYYNRLYTAPSYFYNYYRKILNFFSIRQAINAFFDIIDLTLRLSIFVFLSSSNDNSRCIISSMGSLYSMRKLLREYSSIDFGQVLYIDFLTSEMKNFLWEKLHINISDKIDFDSFLKLIEHLRNVTKAHGFIRENELKIMFQLMFYMSLYVFFELDICSISILNSDKNFPILKFKGNLIESFSKYAFFDSNKELFITTNKQGTYINITTGEIKKVC